MRVDSWSALIEQMRRGSDISNCGEKVRGCFWIALENRKDTHWIHFIVFISKQRLLSCVTQTSLFLSQRGQVQVSEPTLQQSRLIFIFKAKVPERPVTRSRSSQCNVFVLRILYLLSCYSLGFSKACRLG